MLLMFQEHFVVRVYLVDAVCEAQTPFVAHVYFLHI